MRFSTAFVLALPAVAFATAIPRGDGGNCNTGRIQCCKSVQSAKDPASSLLGGLLGLSFGSITGLIGLNCTPLTILGAGGNSCSSQPVCCNNNQFGGLISLGCNPINLNF